MSGPRGGNAQWRHPRAGTGTGSYYYGGGRYGHAYHGHRYYGGHYPYYRGYYPYYRGYYYPYWGPSFSFYWGSPYYYPYRPYYTWPYYAAAPYVAGTYVGGDSYAPSAEAGGYEAPPESYSDAQPTEPPRSGRRPAISIVGDSGQLRLEVRPDDASVYVDDEFRGTAREARQLTLAPGRHGIEIVRPGYATERHMVEIVKDQRTDLLVELRRP